jgi:hypothetical protein
MNRFTLSAAAFAITAGLALTAQAQTAAQNNSDGPLENGRYVVTEGEIGEAGQRVTILLDTRFGRTWVLQAGAEGPNWLRAPMVNMETAPAGMSLRPLPVKPASSTPAKKP